MSMEQHLSLINRHVNTVKDVPAHEFIEVFAQHLKKGNKIKIPDWAQYVKTGCQKELSPYDNDWLYTRAASIAYQLYMRKKVGVNGLRKHYGTKCRYGTKPEHSRRAAGKNIRFCSSEGATITMGKALTKKGIMDMDRIAAQTV